jgi:hypothetical protein
MQFTLTDQDRKDGECIQGESDGTGHVVATWIQRTNTEGHTRLAFVEPRSAAVVGTYDAANLLPIGQASGFMGTTCVDGHCFTNVIVLSPTGQELYNGPPEGPSFGTVNDPTGGLVHLLSKDLSTPKLSRVEAVDASGAVRWSVNLAPPPSGADGYDAGSVDVDREGNVLVFASVHQGPVVAQWVSPAGVPGPQFQPFAPGQFVPALHPRVGNGFFALAGTWIGQFEPFATAMTPPPAWLAARPPANVHMVHGGRGYAFLPFLPTEVAAPPTSDDCSQTIEVVSPSGQSCGKATFSVGGGSCTPSSIVVGYDGTVIQQLPFAREASSCTAAGHRCNCTYRYWSGFFR